jgi:hypothetical protein
MWCLAISSSRSCELGELTTPFKLFSVVTSLKSVGLPVVAARLEYIECKDSGVAAPGLDDCSINPPFLSTAATNSAQYLRHQRIGFELIHQHAGKCVYL